jgi:hypothetical protein
MNDYLYAIWWLYRNFGKLAFQFSLGKNRNVGFFSLKLLNDNLYRYFKNFLLKLRHHLLSFININLEFVLFDT